MMLFTRTTKANREVLKMQVPFKSLPGARRVVPCILLVGSLLWASACANTPTLVSQTGNTTPSGTRPPQSQYPMPPVNANQSVKEYGFTLLDGRRVKMADYAGKVLVLDFWATYCPPCREEIPQLIELQRRYDSQGLNIVGLNVGGDEDRPKVAEFVKSYRIQYTLGYPDTELVNLFLGSNDSIPQTIVFDRRGRLVKHFIGYDRAMPAELEQAIQSALATE
jgi:thiol-disulfide isomerase/thioredoxin